MKKRIIMSSLGLLICLTLASCSTTTKCRCKEMSDDEKRVLQNHAEEVKSPHLGHYPLRNPNRKHEPFVPKPEEPGQLTVDPTLTDPPRHIEDQDK